jgi:cysteine desulfurase family protein (TIGR01976 family)
MALDLERIRRQFPALAGDAVYLDNPAGTQTAKNCLDRMLEYLIETNANHEGAYQASRESDAVALKAREAAADFLGARTPEVVFGANMTTLTFHLARSLARRIGPGDSVAVTRLDHDANVSPWLLLAQDRDAEVLWVDFHPEDGTLDLESLDRALDRKPKLVAVGYASNSLGTINPAAEITARAHAAGALVFIDAVHYAPHGPIDVRTIGCDFLACSAYKFFGPHLGLLYGRSDLLEELFAYKIRPAGDDVPHKFETGTPNFEAIAGLLGTMEYLESVGAHFGEDPGPVPGDDPTGRREKLRRAAAAIGIHERALSLALLEMLQAIPGLRIYGLTDRKRIDERVATFAFRLPNLSPRRIAEELDKDGLYARDGNYYALEVTKRLDVEDKGGMLRVGAVHYNTLDDIDRFGKSLARIAGI